MADDLGKLSSEDILRFSKTVSEVKALTARQEEIAKKVLAVEKDIGKVRIAALNDFFDAYSEGLDKIVAKKTSELNDAFLVMEREATKSFKKAAESAKKSSSTRGSGGSGGGGGSRGGNGGGDGSDSGSSGRASRNIRGRHLDTQSEILSDETRNQLGEARTAEKIVERLNAFTKNNKTVEEQINSILSKRYDSVVAIEQLKDARNQKRQEMADKYRKKEERLESTLTSLTMARLQERQDREAAIRAEQITQHQAVLDAELSAQNLLNEIIAKRNFAATEDYQEIGGLRSRKFNVDAEQKALTQIEEQRNAFIKRKELESARKNNGILTAEEATRIQKLAANKFKIDKANLEKINKQQIELDASRAAAEERANTQKNLKALQEAKTLEERKQAWRDLTQDENGDKSTGKIISAALTAVSDLATQLEKKIDAIAEYKGAIDTRLQGSNNETWAGSYWDQLVHDMTSVGAITPYFKQETFANNIRTLVERGISFDLKQRAFLMTISDKIANTFNAADGTLLRLIRIQQEDSTAGRLGMESALNTFLNNMYENTEYLSEVAASVRNSLEEMESLMSGAEATEVEYQVQKWLGSLYSVGMSNSAVNSISTALGQIAAGQIEGLTGSGAGNLLVMAANDAGLSIADILTDGLDSEETNRLLQASVDYLAELAESSKDNNVVQQQLANVFGVKASDLRAAANLTIPGSTSSIFGNSMTYDNMLAQLSSMAGSMASRSSLAEMMTNIWENGMYSMAGSMASNPVSYFIYKLASVVDDTAGGIDLPFVNVMGFGVDLNTTVSDLMRVAAVGTGLLGSLGPMLSGLSSSFSGQAMLNKMGIGVGSGLAVNQRGSGSSVTLESGGAQTLTESGYIGNASGSDVKDSTIQEAEDSKKQQMIEAKEEEEANQVTVLNDTVIKIYELLDDVAKGNSTFRVKVEGYGLTNVGSSGTSSGALGGVDALNRNNGGSNSTSGNGVNSGGVSGSVDFGGWVMV
jgi:hypothetical protein